MSVYANFSSNEASTSGTATVTFPWKARQITITNDSAVHSLEYKFNTSEDYGTLLPTETLALHHHARDVILNSPSGNSVAYRVWGYG